MAGALAERSAPESSCLYRQWERWPGPGPKAGRLWMAARRSAASSRSGASYAAKRPARLSEGLIFVTDKDGGAEVSPLSGAQPLKGNPNNRTPEIAFAKGRVKALPRLLRSARAPYQT